MSKGRTRSRMDDPGQSAKPSIPLSTAYESFVDFHRRKASAKGYLDQIEFYLADKEGRKSPYKPFLTWFKGQGILELSGVTKDSLGAYLTHVRGAATEDAYGKSVSIVRRFLKYLIEEGHLDSLPIRLPDPKAREREIKVFTDDEMERLEKVVRNEPARDYAIFMLMLDTGLRSNELTSLRICDVRLERMEVNVPAEVAKNSKSRTLPISPASAGPLRRYLAQRAGVKTKPDEQFFVGSFSTPVYAGGTGKSVRRTLGTFVPAKEPFTYSGVYHLVTKWGRLAGISEARCSPHTFRHYFAITYLRQNGDVLTLQRMLGHSKLDMVQRYARMAQCDVKRVHAQSSPALKFMRRNRTKLDLGETA